MYYHCQNHLWRHHQHVYSLYPCNDVTLTTQNDTTWHGTTGRVICTCRTPAAVFGQTGCKYVITAPLGHSDAWNLFHASRSQGATALTPVSCTCLFIAWKVMATHLRAEAEGGCVSVVITFTQISLSCTLKSTTEPCYYTFSVICVLLHFNAVFAANICHD